MALIHEASKAFDALGLQNSKELSLESGAALAAVEESSLDAGKLVLARVVVQECLHLGIAK